MSSEALSAPAMNPAPRLGFDRTKFSGRDKEHINVQTEPIAPFR